MSLLSITQLTIKAIDNTIIFKDFNLSLDENSIVGIYGKGGCGKTTLAYSIAGIIPHYLQYQMEGDILINNKNILNISRNLLGNYVGIIFQNPDYQLFFHKGKMEINFSPFMNNLIKRYHLESLLEKKVDWLSYGEKKLVILLSVISFHPKIVILDEVFSSLDKYYFDILFTLLDDYKNNNNLILIIENEKNKLPTDIRTIKFNNQLR